MYMKSINTAVQNQKTVSAHFASEQILSFGFAEDNSRPMFCMYCKNTFADTIMWRGTTSGGQILCIEISGPQNQNV